MKRFLALAAALMLALSLAACNNNASPTQEPTQAVTPTEENPGSNADNDNSGNDDNDDNNDNGNNDDDDSGQQNNQEPLADIMTKLTEGVDGVPMSEKADITADNFTYFLFIDPIEGAEGMSADAMIGSIPHSVCLLRLPEGADAAAVASEIENNADPRKWICVESEKVIVKHKDNLVLLVMSFEETADAIAANFDNI